MVFKCQLTISQESEIITLYQQGMGLNAIIKKFHTSYPTVVKILDNSTVTRRKIPILDDLDDNKIVQLYEVDRISIVKISEKFSISQSRIREILTKNNIAIDNHIKYNINHDFLNEINSPEKAYFVGFFLADGHKADPKLQSFRMQIKLKDEDRAILRRFNELLCPQDLISTFQRRRTPEDPLKTYSEICFNSKQIYQELTKLGCDHLKSATLKFNEYLEERVKKYFSHFVRGYFDGDGCLRFKKTGAGEVDICVTGNFGRKLQELLENYEMRSRLYECESIYKIEITKQKTIKKFLDFLYQDSTIHLDRKFKLYQQYQEYVKNCKRPKIFL